MLRKALHTWSERTLIAFVGFVALMARVEGAALSAQPPMSVEAGTSVLPGASFATLLPKPVLGSAQEAFVEPAPSLRLAISDNAIRYPQMEQTLADALSNTTFARGARRGGGGGGSLRRPRSGFGDGHMGSGFGDLVGGSFAWPYFKYCTRHPGDQNC